MDTMQRLAFFALHVSLCFAAAASPAAAERAPLFDLDPYSMRSLPDGAFRTFGTAICPATNAPPAAALSMRARVRPERCEAQDWGTLGIVAYRDPENYWQISLFKAPDKSKGGPRRYFQLKAMADGFWEGEKKTARRIFSETLGGWDYGREYDLALEVAPDRVEGVVKDAETGEILYRAAFEPGSGASAARSESRPAPLYRPALYANGWFHATISSVETATPDAPAPDTTAKTDDFPPFVPSGPETGLYGSATGFFHLEDIDGRSWPVDPAGRAVILAGVQHVKPWGVFSDAANVSPYGRFVDSHYASVADWADETLARISDWGFTMLGNGSDLSSLAHRALPHFRDLQMGQRVSRGDPEWYVREWELRPCSALPNVFHPDFLAACEWRARQICTPSRDDPWLIGWFIDNELAWWGKNAHIKGNGVYDLVAALPEEHSARRALDSFLAERGLAVGPDVPREAKEGFLRLYARTYFEKTAAAIRKIDPNHMILGARFAGIEGAPPVVWEEAGRVCDVVTFNCYPWADLARGVVLDDRGGVPMSERLREFGERAGAPLMVSEWSFSALDHGHPCTLGGGQRFRTQSERVQAAMLFAKTLLADPRVVGYDWFKWNDQPKTGSSRHNPEDCNYGLVNDDGDEYAELVGAFKALHSDLPRWRGAPSPKPRDAAPEPSERDRFFAANGTASGGADVFAALSPDGSFVLSNGLVRLAGRVGAPWAAGEVTYGAGASVGRLGALLAAEDGDVYTWTDVSRLESVAFERDETRGAVSAILRAVGGRAAEGSGDPGADAGMPPENRPTGLSFAITLRVTLLPGRADALVQIESLENLSASPLAASAVFLRAFAHGAKSAASGPKVPNLVGAPKTAAWELPGGGSWGFSTHDGTARKFMFFVSSDGVQHPDTAFSPVVGDRTFSVAPGETWRPPVPMAATLFLAP